MIESRDGVIGYYLVIGEYGDMLFESRVDYAPARGLFLSSHFFVAVERYLVIKRASGLDLVLRRFHGRYYFVCR